MIFISVYGLDKKNIWQVVDFNTITCYNKGIPSEGDELLYSVEVYAKLLQDERVTRFLVFDTYTSAANCIMTLTGREQGPHSPEEYFEAGDLYRTKQGEQLGEAIETDWVLTYLEKTKN